MARVQRPSAVELGEAAFRVHGTTLANGRNRRRVADAQRVAVRGRCFRGRCRSDLPDAEPDDGGGYKRRGENETASCIH